MKYLAFAFVITIFTSCCPKISSVVETRSYELPADTDTVYVNAPVLVPEAHSDSLHIDLMTLCDSLLKGLLKPQIRRSTDAMHRVSNIPIPITTIQIDSSGIATIFCNIPAYQDTIRNLKQLNINLRSIIQNTTTRTITPYWYNLFKYGFFICGAFCIIGIYLFVKK